MTDERQTRLRERELDLRRQFEQTYGRVMSSSQIGKLLVYPSPAAFRQAIHRGAVKIRMFSLPERRGQFAMTADVARWLAEHVEAGEEENEPEGGFEKAGSRTVTRV